MNDYRSAVTIGTTIFLLGATFYPGQAHAEDGVIDRKPPKLPLSTGTAINVLTDDSGQSATSRGPIKVATPDSPLPIDEIIQSETVGKVDLFRSKAHDYSKFFSLGAVKKSYANEGRPYALCLKRVLELALDNNLDIKVARAQAQQQTASAGTALSRFLPSVDLNLGRERVKSEGLVENAKSYSVGWTYPVSRGGSVLFGSAAQIETARAAWKSKYAQVNDTLFQAATAYANLTREQARLQVRISALRISNYWYNELSERYQVAITEAKAGSGDNQLSSARAAGDSDYQSKLNNAEKICLMRKQFEAQMYLDFQELISQTLAVKRAGIDLASLLSFQLPRNNNERWNGQNIIAREGWIAPWKWIRVVNDLNLDHDLLRHSSAPDNCEMEVAQLKSRSVAPVVLEVACPPVPPPKGVRYEVQHTLQQLIGLAVMNRPELQQFDLLRKAAKLNTEPALANMAPSIDLFVNRLKIGDDFAEAANIRTSGFDFNVLFENMGVGNITDFARRCFVVRQLTFQYNQTLVAIVNEVSKAYLDMISAEAQFLAAEKGAAQASSFLDRVWPYRSMLNQSGAPDVQDIINAERQYVSTMFGQIDAATQRNIAQAALIRAIGTNPLEQKRDLKPMFK